MPARNRQQVRSRVANRLNAGLFVVGDICRVRPSVSFPNHLLTEVLQTVAANWRKTHCVCIERLALDLSKSRSYCAVVGISL